MPWAAITASGIVLSVKVRPNCSETCVTSRDEDYMCISIGAVPDKGKANKELVQFLARACGVTKESVRILKGEKSHTKVVSIALCHNNDNPEQLLERLSKC
ncbi:uncharacterized protein PAPHI01_0241 [Pancytospora philotis]|nr:uncharacterized protein PAPHI01_0241 [Pancytospora philotis]